MATTYAIPFRLEQLRGDPKSFHDASHGLQQFLDSPEERLFVQLPSPLRAFASDALRLRSMESIRDYDELVGDESDEEDDDVPALDDTATTINTATVTQQRYSHAESSKSVKSVPADSTPYYTYNHQQIVFECPMDFLRCGQKFVRKDRWLQHSLNHFCDFAPPVRNFCYLCDQHFEGRDSWAIKLQHILDAHYKNGEILRNARPAFELHDWFWEKGLMTLVQRKDLRNGGTLCEKGFALTPTRVTYAQDGAHKKVTKIVKTNILDDYNVEARGNQAIIMPISSKPRDLDRWRAARMIEATRKSYS